MSKNPNLSENSKAFLILFSTILEQQRLLLESFAESPGTTPTKTPANTAPSLFLSCRYSFAKDGVLYELDDLDSMLLESMRLQVQRQQMSQLNHGAQICIGKYIVDLATNMIANYE